MDGFDAMKLLLAHKADAKIKADDERNVLEFLIAEKGDSAFQIIKQLYVKEKMCDMRKERGKMTHLHLCCVANKRVQVTKIAELFLDHSYEKGKFINATEGGGR